MAYETLTSLYLSTLSFDSQHSRLDIGGTAVAFHCDKFNTRILKNFEDVMGYQEGGQLLASTAERTSYVALEHFLGSGAGATQFAPLDLAERLEAICELFKVLAYGAISLVEATPERCVFESATSYLAAGWLENRERWHLDEREGPACHDVRGHLAAAVALAAGKPEGSYMVSETGCRAYQDGPVCRFVAEVKP